MSQQSGPASYRSDITVRLEGSEGVSLGKKKKGTDFYYLPSSPLGYECPDRRAHDLFIIHF